MTATKKSVVVVGGGTGTHTVLRGLKRYSDQIDITAIVSMADSGGSTGRLRDEFGHLPVGDVRMALTALAAELDDHDNLLRELFLYRFQKGEGLSGHNFGNLLLTALTDLLGTEEAAVLAAARILRVRGEVLPVTNENVHLRARYDDNTEMIGEHEIDEPPPQRHAQRIVELSVTPRAHITPAVARALRSADLVVLGPGDLYSSVLANVVVEGFAEALKDAARVMYVCNLMSRPGQTVGMHAPEHVAEVVKYTKRTPDVVVVHDGRFSASVLEKYRAEGNHPIESRIEDIPTRVRFAALAALQTHVSPAGDVLERSLVRHDPEKLSSVIMDEL